jgi:SAM-dependent methyltransferase
MNTPAGNQQSGTTNTVSHCEVCGETDLPEVLNLGLHPLCDDLVKAGDSRVCKEYPIVILYCQNCRTAHQKYQVPKRDLFPQTYHYRARFTNDVLVGMKSLVSECAELFGKLDGKRVLDIGCNDGSLLNFFRDRGARTYGIEPTSAYLDAESGGHRVIHGFLSVDVANQFVSREGRPDFITFTNVFAHIEDLSSVIQAIGVLLKPETVLVIENHHLGAVLQGAQFDTFYHEHPRTYSYSSFVQIARNLGLSISSVQFPKRYGGNIRVFMARDAAGTAAPRPAEVSEQEEQYGAMFGNLAACVERWRIAKGQYIRELVAQYGPLRAKAFPGRAAILIRLLNLDNSEIEAVYEKPGSKKIGHYAPGTRIPILSDDELMKHSNVTGPLLNLAWHIPTEIRTYLEAIGYRGDVIDVIDSHEIQGLGLSAR